MVHTLLFQKSYLFFLSIKQFKFVVFRKQNHARMRVECQNYCFSMRFLCNFLQTVNNFLMPQVNPVKSTGGYHRKFYTLKLSYIIVYFHPLFCESYDFKQGKYTTPE